MAMPTSSSSTPVMQGAAPTSTPPADPPQPVLFEGIQPVYLCRLYPEQVSEGIGDAVTAALEAGNAARSAGMELKAAQQEPIPAPAAEPEPPPPSGFSETVTGASA